MNTLDTLRWDSPEYMHTYKSADWYWIVGIVTFTLAIISVIFGNPVFGIFIIVAAFTLCIAASRPPQIVSTEVSDKGIKVKNLFYSWSTLESFWIEEYELHPRLLIKSEKRWAPYLIVLLSDEVSPEDLREKLATHLPEVRHSEPFLEKLLIWAGF